MDNESVDVAGKFRPLRILLVNTLYAPYSVGGAELSVKELAEDLSEMGHDVCVLTLMEKSSDLPDNEVISGVRVQRLPLPRRWPFGPDNEAVSMLAKLSWHFQEDVTRIGYGTVRGLLKDFRPDVVNTHNLAGFGTRIWHEFAGTPLVHTVRDYYLACVRTTLYKNGLCEDTCGECVAATHWRRRRTGLPDAYIGVSHRILEIHTDKGLISKDATQYVVPNQPRNLPGADEPENGRIAAFRSRKTAIFGYMGRLEEAKGLPLVLKAMNSPSLSGAGLLIAGNGTPSEVRELEALSESSDRVLYIGKAQPADYLALIDIALVPTQWEEPFGRVAMEAANSGVGVIASNIGGLPEVLRGYPRAMLVDDLSSISSWMEAMEEAYSKFTASVRETRVATSPRATASPVPVAARYEAIYRCLLEQ